MQILFSFAAICVLIIYAYYSSYMMPALSPHLYETPGRKGGLAVAIGYF